MTELIIPHSRETEEAFLGSLLIAPHQVNEIDFDAYDLYIHKHRWIYQALCESSRKHGETDYLLVCNELEEMGYLEEVGGPAYLTGLINQSPNAYNAPKYAREIRGYAERRDWIETANMIARQAYEGDVNPAIIQARMGEIIRSDGEMRHVSELTKEYRDYIQERKENPSDVWGIPWPWLDMNKITGGIHKRRSIVIIGDTGIGKTVSLGQIGFYAAERGYNVRMYEMEMSFQDIIGRQVSAMTEISDWKDHRGKLSSTEEKTKYEALDKIDRWPIVISEKSSWTSAAIRADIAKAGGCDLVLIDHLGKLKDKAETEHEKIKIAAENIRDAAKDLRFAVISVGTLVKDGTMEGVKRVQYEQDEIFKMEKGQDNIVTIYPGKQRHGGGYARVDLVMRPGLPLLADAAKPFQQESIDEYFHD